MSYAQYLQGRAIRTGCEWRLKIHISASAASLFPDTARFVSQFRDGIDGSLKLTLSSEAGTIIRVDENTLEFVVPGAETVSWPDGTVVMDVIRVDLTERIHLGFDLEIPVRGTVTRIA